MGDRIVVEPVNGVLKAFRKAIVLTQRISKVARNVSPTAGQALELAQSLEKSLAESEAQINAAYNQGITALGNQYADAIAQDHVVINQFQGLTISLLDQVMNLGDYMDAPEDFDVLSLRDMQQESEQACDQMIKILDTVYQKLFTAVLQQHELPRPGNQERVNGRTEEPRSVTEVSPTQSTSPAVIPPFPLNSQFIGKSATGTVPDLQDSRIAANRQGGTTTTNDSPQRPATDDRELLPSQRGLSMPRHDFEIPTVDTSTSIAVSPTLPVVRPFSGEARIQYPSTMTFARPPSFPAQSPWDDSPATSANKSVTLPIIPDERQAALDSSIYPKSRPQISAATDSQIAWSNVSISSTPISYVADTESGEARGIRNSHPLHYQSNTPTGTSHSNYEGEIRPLNLKPKRSHITNDSSPKLIDRESVVPQMTSNENLLEKRRKSKTSFRHDMDSMSQSNISAGSSPKMTPEIYPPPLTFAEIPLSPLRVSRPNSTLFRPLYNHEGQSPTPSKTPSPRSSAALPDRPTSTEKIIEFEQPQTRNSPAMFESPSSIPGHIRSERFNSIASQSSVSGMSESPPLTMSSDRQSAAEDWGFLGRSLKVPGSTERFDEGMEVVTSLVSDSGLMLASEIEPIKLPTPAVSIQVVDYPLRHDSSFFVYGGFCESAKRLVRGDESALKVIKKAGSGGILQISKKCTNCAYEMDFNVWERDQAGDPAGIYTIGGINFRLKLLSKCHVATKHTGEPAYACIFCIEEGKTVDEYDATVFFSVKHFLRHLRKHPRPLKQVEGLTVVYGDDPGTVNFDIHFKTMEQSLSPFGEIGPKISSRPKAHAIVNHRPKGKGFKETDPEKVATLRFAQGARIVGITYPARLNGAWCCGYHDEEKAHFPVSAVVLEPPSGEEYVTDVNSARYAIAKWDHKPKDASAGWLTFSKNEKITNIGFKFQEAWCWTGQNAKGKWGFFPACFVDGLGETALERSPRATSLSRPVSGEAPRSHSGSSFRLSHLSTRPFTRRSTSGSRSSG